MATAYASKTIRQRAASSRLLRASDLDVSSEAMSRMEVEGVLERILPGVYVGTEHLHHPLIRAAAWTLKYPRAVACLLTAAAWHDLTDAFPRGTWLYVPKGTTVPRSRVARVEVVQTAPRFIDPMKDEEIGVVGVEVHGVQVRITNPDRTTLDLWRYPRRVPAEYALDALSRRFRAEDFYLPGFARLGRRLGVWRRVEPVVQGLVLR